MPTRDRPRVCALVLAIGVWTGMAGFFLPVLPASAALVADSADDVCAASAEPCVIAQQVEVVAGSRLDFGLRTLRIEGAGLLDFGGGDTGLACGRLEVTTDGVAIRARGGDSTCSVTLQVRRRCSLATATACFVDADCPVVAGGACSGGDGDAVIDGGINGSADDPGRVVVKSAGDLSLLAAAVVTGTRTPSDGGVLELESTGGSVVVAGPVDVSGGGGGSGGEFLATAAVDIQVHAAVTANGGEYDGGSVTLEAGRDVTITDDVHADSVSGAGLGGEVDVSAGRDLTIAGGSPSNNLVIGADGHQSAENFGGDGGTQAFAAGGDIVVSRHVRFSANGAPPDGFADSLTFSAEGGITFDGSVVARGRGAYGGGGLVDLIAERDIRASATASFDLTGPAAGGDLMIEGDGALSFAAVVDVSGGTGGLGGRVVAVAGGDADVSGRWTTAGADSAFSVGDLFLEACRVRVSGVFTNTGVAGRNRIVAHDSISIPATGAVLASGDGAGNSFRYRRAAGPPVVEGLVSPSPSLVVDAALAMCAVCGNAEREVGESCDDGNVADGDGCSSRCQDEGCEAATPGYPAMSLCSDADECTIDHCDVTRHRCEHLLGDCTDGVACTTDSCSAGVCRHEPLAASCDDANVCTADSCSAISGCQHAALALGCDDGVFCNGADTCRDGACADHDGDPCAGGPECADECNEAAASCLSPAGAACSDDFNVCTDDACDGHGLCMHAANAAPCQARDFCSVGGACMNGSCETTAAPLLAVVSLRARTGGVAGRDRVTWKVEFPASLLAVAPSDAGLRIVLLDRLSLPLLDSTLPAGSFHGDERAWRFKAPADGAGAGIVKASIGIAGQAGVARARFKVLGLGLAETVSVETMSLALLLGDDLGTAPCASSGDLVCERGRRVLACASTP